MKENVVFRKIRGRIIPIKSSKRKLPGKHYPPASIEHSVKDFSEKMLHQWDKVQKKYPQARKSWGAAVNIWRHSVNKNVFKLKGTNLGSLKGIKYNGN